MICYNCFSQHTLYTVFTQIIFNFSCLRCGTYSRAVLIRRQRLFNLLTATVRGKRKRKVGLVVLAKFTAFTLNWRMRRFWRENWMIDRWDVLTLNWKTSLLMKVNSHCWVRTALQRVQCIFFILSSYGNTWISTTPKLRHLFEGGAY